MISEIITKTSFNANTLAIEYGQFGLLSGSDNDALSDHTDYLAGCATRSELSSQQRYELTMAVLKRPDVANYEAEERVKDLIEYLSLRSRALCCEGIGEALCYYVMINSFDHGRHENYANLSKKIKESIARNAKIPERLQSLFIPHATELFQNPFLSKDIYATLVNGVKSTIEGWDVERDAINLINRIPTALSSPHLEPDLMNAAISSISFNPGLELHNNIKYISVGHLCANPNLPHATALNLLFAAEILSQEEGMDSYKITKLQPIYENPVTISAMKSVYGDGFISILSELPQLWINNGLEPSEVVEAITLRLECNPTTKSLYPISSLLNSSLNAWRYENRYKFTTQQYSEILSSIENNTSYGIHFNWMRAIELGKVLQAPETIDGNKHETYLAMAVLNCCDGSNSRQIEKKPTFEHLLNVNMDLMNQENKHLNRNGMVMTPLSYIIESVAENHKDELLAIALQSKLNQFGETINPRNSRKML